MTRATARTRVSSSPFESLLRFLGVHESVIEEVLGDLAEEYSLRSASDGEYGARWWYLREVVRSAPHLGVSALRRAARHHPARLIALVALFGLVASLIVGAVLTADGPPAFLTTGRAGDLVVNSVRPVKIPMQVGDAAGHVLPDSGVRYRWTSGTAVAVSPGGIITCMRPGDATVRASLGALATRVSVRCRPVKDVRAPARLDLVVGGPAQDVPFEATDSTGRPVTLLAGQIRVGDSTIASLDGQRIRGRATGSTWLVTRIGNRQSFTSVHVFQRASRVSRVDSIRAGQRLAVLVRFGSGEMHQWSIPAGHYSLAMLADADEHTQPELFVAGATCERVLDHPQCVARERATVIAYCPQRTDQARASSANLAIWRQEDP